MFAIAAHYEFCAEGTASSCSDELAGRMAREGGMSLLVGENPLTDDTSLLIPILGEDHRFSVFSSF